MIKNITLLNGHKVAQTVTNREDFLALRNSATNLSNLSRARQGDAEAKAQLVQFAYNDMMPDGKVAGCCHPSDCFFHDIDCYDAAQTEQYKALILQKKDEIGLLMLERSVGGGWHLVCRRQLGKTILENQVRIASIMKIEMDTNCHDLGRVVYSTSGNPDDLVYLDDALFESTICIEDSEREYQLLKERVRDGREEVPQGAKSDQKHYRPWEEEERRSIAPSEKRIVKSEEIATADLFPQTFPDNYHGHKFPDIIRKYWEVNNRGYEPTIGDRDTKTYQLARDLQHICGRNFDWLDQVIPCYDGFPLEEKRAKIRSALQSSYEGMPKSMQDVLDALEKADEPEAEVVKTDVQPTDFFFNAPQPPRFPDKRKQPKLIQLLISRTPGIYQPAVADAVFPSLGTHLFDTWFKYTDNKQHEATLMNCLVAESGAGKSCIDEPINHIMADIRERDAVNERREDDYKQECNSKGANKDKPTRPEGLIIQEIHGDMTNAALVTRLDEAEGHFLYVKVNEIQMFDALKGNGKAGHQYMLMCLSFDPNNRYGQTRIGTMSVSKTVCVRFNWNACTTEHKVKHYFKSVVEDGPVQRVNFCTIPEREIGAEQLVYGDYDAAFDAALKPYIANLCAARGLVDCPQAFRLAKKLQKECQEIAILSQSRVFDSLAHRACVIAWLKACVLYVANGCKWEKGIETFVRWSLQNDLWCKMHYFGEMLENGADKYAVPHHGPRNQLQMLPNVYTLDDVKTVRLKCGMKEDGADAQNRQWISRGFVEAVTDVTVQNKTFRKLKYLTA
ncbi:MAG: hypothetical protein J5502_08225 [Prevotella sp.]|nr:hypothetical protein [Prevotella sp.]